MEEHTRETGTAARIPDDTAGEGVWQRAGSDHSGQRALVWVCIQDLTASWEAVVGVCWWVEFEGHGEGSQVVMDTKIEMMTVVHRHWTHRDWNCQGWAWPALLLGLMKIRVGQD